MAIKSMDFDYVRKLVLEHSAIVLEDGKDYLVEMRLLPLAQDQGFTTLDDLVSALRTKSFGHLHQLVVEAMTTNETSFFRDRHPFDTLKSTIIPEFLELRSSDQALDIWCMACSSGQEPYSILLTIQEHFRQLSGWKIRLLGSDISREMLDRTQHGTYSQLEVNRGLPAPLLVKHFARQGTHWQVKPEIRQMLELREINLAKPWPQVRPMDIIFLRNVLIYFDVATKKDILRRVARVLKPEGYLFMGGAETVSGLDDQFERVTHGRTVCYRLRSGSQGEDR